MEQADNIANKLSNFVTSVRKIISKTINPDGSFNNGFLLRKLMRIIAAFLILWLSHLLGSHINRRIERHMRKADEERRDRLRERGGQHMSSNDRDQDDLQDEEESMRSRNSLAQLGGRVAYIAIMTIGFLIVLRVLGVEIATIIALVSMVGFAIGFAVQGTLSDIAAGILLAVFQTYEVGDIIKLDDYEGRVIDFRVVNTLLQNIETMTLLTVPNRVIQDSVITNYSRSHYHIFQFFINVSNRQKDEDLTIEKVIKFLREDLMDEKKYPDILRSNSLNPLIGVSSMEHAGTKLSVRVYITADDIDIKREHIKTGMRKVLDDNSVVLLDYI